MDAGRPPAPMSLLVARSLRWVFGSAALSAIVQLATASVLARLIDPVSFGLVAVANAVLRYVFYLTDLGQSQMALRAVRFDSADRTVLAATATAFSLFAAVMIAAAAPTVVALIPGATAAAAPVLAVLASGLVLTAIGESAAAQLRREMNFRPLAKIPLVAQVVAQVAVGLPLALAGTQVWALVAAALAQSALTSILLLRLRPWHLRSDGQTLSSAATRLRGMMHFAWRLMAIRVLDATFLQMQPMAVAMIAGIAAAGYFDRAFVLAVVPMELVAGSVGRVLNPAFAALARERPAGLAPALTMSLRLLAGVCFPLAAGMAAASGPLVTCVLGPRWDAAIPLFAWLGAAATLRAVSATAGAMVEACGALHWHLAQRGLVIALLAGGVGFGPARDAAGITALCALAEFVSMICLLALAAQAAKGTLRGLLSALGGGIWNAVLVSALASGAVGLADGAQAQLASALVASAAGLVLGITFSPCPSLRRDLGHRLSETPFLGRAAGLMKWLAR